ncbi:MAG TPA: LytTR family DNA-binding domain-containing protein [Steroidobacteraceae bacterium]|jgi:DNA-binding LytR/AlgR family response regulator
MNTVLIADDEPQLAQDLARRIKRCWSDVEIVAVVENGLQAAAELRRLNPAYAFLDIRMPGLSGLEVAAAAEMTRIVFVTAYEEFAVAAFEAAAVDYLVKPVSNARLAQCVLKLQNSAAPRPDLGSLFKEFEQPKQPVYLAWVHTGAGNTTRVLSVSEILYFQTGDKYTEVVTVEGRHVIRMSLKELLRRLDPQQFTQIHRSTIVNLHFVAKLERDVLGRALIHLKSSHDILQVGRAFLAQFRHM